MREKNKKAVWIAAAVCAVLMVCVIAVVIKVTLKPKTEQTGNKTESTAENTVKEESTTGEEATGEETTGEETKPEETKQEETTGQNPAEDGEYILVWEDEFEGDSLNMDDWNYEYHEPGWVNNELQEYVDSPENIYVKDGELVIQALKKEENGTVTYTSGRINTQNKHDYKYGKFEVKAKVSSGKGFLPAFWMMPTDENLYGQWPKCGEIDIMEVLGNETNKTYATLHFGEPHTQSQGSHVLETGDFSSEYHVFTCEWEPGEMRFYVDGILYHKENDWFTKKSGFGEVTYPAPYDQPFYMILNLAVGGSWPGNPDETMEFGENATLKVDYVRVYQKESYDENVSKPQEELVFRDVDETGNYIVNGDFEEEDLLDTDNWQFLLAGEGEATASISENTLHIETVKEGTLDYSVQMVQPGLPMVKGCQYKVTFDAYADEARKMIVDISAPDKGWIRYLADTQIELTTEKKSYEFTLSITSDSDANGRLEFNLGNQGSCAAVHISNVRVEKTGEEQIKEEKMYCRTAIMCITGSFSRALTVWNTGLSTATARAQRYL